MPMPFLSENQLQAEFIEQFGGYNHNNHIADGEFYDMQNLSCDDYPLASTRGKRGIMPDLPDGTSPISATGKDDIMVCYNSGAEIYTDEDIDSFPDIQRFDISDSDTYVNGGYQKLTYVDYGFGIDKFTDESYAKAIIRKNNFESFPVSCLPSEYPEVKNIAFSGDAFGIKFDDETTEGWSYFNLAQMFVPFSNGLYADWYEAGGHLYVIVAYYQYSTLRNVDFNIIQELRNAHETNEIRFVLTSREYPNITEPNAMKVLSVGELNNYTTYMTGENVGYVINLEIPYSYKKFIASQFSSYRGHCLYWSVGYVSGTFYNLSYDDVIRGYETVSVHSTGEAMALDEFDNKVVTIDGIEYTFIGHNDSQVYLKTPHAELSANTLLTDQQVCTIADYNSETGALSNITAVGAHKTGEAYTVDFGANIVVFPEKKMVNTAKIIDSAYEVTSLEKYDSTCIDMMFCTMDGKIIGRSRFSNDAPEEPENGRVWVDTSETPYMLKKYSEALGTWSTAQLYLEIIGVEEDFEEGDAVDIVWSDDMKDNIDGKHWNISWAGIHDETQGTHHWQDKKAIRFPVSAKGHPDDFNIFGAGTIVYTEVPEMDYVFECNNRLWGCRYGTNKDGDFVNEIFACKLGDPRNWNYFSNTSVDSYYLSLGDNGEFTGGIAYNSKPVFFRADKIHVIDGFYPANYQITTISGYGCAKGSNKSIKQMNNIVYYLANTGVMAWSGDSPIPVSAAFGENLYHDGIAGQVGNKYYLSCLDKQNNCHLFVYDDAKAMWHQEDDLRPLNFFNYEGECYCITSEPKIIATGGEAGAEEPDFDFLFQTGNLGYGSPFKKHITKLLIRSKTDITTRASVEIQYDSDGVWRRICNIRPRAKFDTMSIPVLPTRCDHFAIRIKGHGNMKIISVTKFYEEGSDNR